MDIISSIEKTENPYTDVVRALELSGCPYLIIGGVAVVLHGSNRFTPDVNIFIDFSSPHFPRAIAALERIGLQYAAGDSLPDVTDAAVRQSLYQGGEVLLRFEDVSMPNFAVDMLLADIGDFEELYARRNTVAVATDTVSVIGLDDLMSLKRELNRMQDQVDVAQLELLRKILQHPDPENAFEELEEEAPNGFERSSFESLLAFQALSVEERFSWLRDVLGAVGGFCMF